MSDYQARKAQMLALQVEKEKALKRELEYKASKEKQLVKEAEERRKLQDAAAREARRRELMQANEALNKKSNGGDVKKELDYDPFAEDARPVPVIVKPTIKSVKGGNAKAGPSRLTSSKQTIPGPSVSSSKTSRNVAKQKDKSQSPPPLGRKERAAKAFAQSAKKSAGDSLFSIRSLVESRDAPGPSTVQRGAMSRSASGNALGLGNGNGNRYGSTPTVAVHGIGMTNGLRRDPNQIKIIPGKPKGTTRDQISAQAKMEGLRKLCPDRATRDRRTIEEIQRDIKAKRIPNPSGNGSISPARKDKPLPHGRARSPIKASKNISPPKSSKISSSAMSKLPPPRGNEKKRRPSPSSSSSASSDENSPPRKKRPLDPYRRSPPPTSHLDVSAQIQALFRRPGAAPKRYNDQFSDDESDMEAGLSDVEEEERRTARIARLEDERAEKEEREHKLAKEKRKKELERAKLKGK
ncbi:uncharacterized protein IL334_003258 [Kwoniella shivajii]|uniref:Protein SPT2 n=1 Tax=Kwoniella shivajii TaxID=564305 RepID=A0ABZ1CYS2_9TREE|nr:hypothetical protein IL334_003258 [Kwoniella shivajii]